MATISATNARTIPTQECLSLGNIRSKASSAFLKAASILSNPACFCAETYVRIKSPMLPGHYGQQDTKTKEIAARALRGACALACLIPVGFSGFLSMYNPLFWANPLFLVGLPGTICRVIGANLQKDGYHYVKGEAKENHTNKFKLMTWNILCMAGLAMSCGGLPLTNARINRIIDKIKTEDPDVLVLQEVWDRDTSDKLVKGLKKNYAHFYTQIGANPSGSPSALFVASKLPVNSFKFTPYTHATGDAKWIKKGFASFDVQTTKQPIHVMTSHLQHGGESKEVTNTREHQIKQVVAHVKGIKHPVFFAGDINVNQDGEEYQNSSLSRFFQPTLNIQDKGTCTNFFEAQGWKGKQKIDPRAVSKPDYIARLAINPETNQEVPQGNLQVNTRKVLAFDASKKYPDITAASDHHGLLATITT